MTCYIEQVLPLHTIGIAAMGIAIIGLASTAWLVNFAAGGPVSRARLERFARRQRLVVTATNGNLLIAYLARVRRWRSAGLITGVVLTLVWSIQHDGVTLNALSMFAGWFAGALVAEVSQARVPSGPRRVAALQPRLPHAYVSRFSWALVPVTAGLSVAIAAGTAIEAGRGRMSPDWTAWVWLGLALVVAVLVRLTQRHVLNRSQALDEPDVLAADDAIRSRSLHVLCGGGAALILYCCSGQLAALQLSFGQPFYEPVLAAQGLGLFLIPALGWNVATSAWRVRREHPLAAAA
jgi:hypothetical protein